MGPYKREAEGASPIGEEVRGGMREARAQSDGAAGRDLRDKKVSRSWKRQRNEFPSGAPCRHLGFSP